MRLFERVLRQRKKAGSGFTLIEILVAVLVLAVGLLGMAAMTIMVMRGNSMAVRQTAATNLAQQLIERLKDVDYIQLGGLGSCNADTTSNIGNAQTATACKLNDLNVLGCQATDTSAPCPGQAPYIYDVFVTICDSTSVTPSVSATANRCNLNNNLTANAPAELVCTAGSLNAGEKQIKVMVSWYDSAKVSDGNTGCRFVALETIVVQP